MKKTIPQRITVCILAIVFMFFSGCLENQSQIKSNGAFRIDTCAGMTNYLKKQNLPALESVQTWENKYGPGLKLTTDHYEILTTLLEPLMLSQVPGFVESSYRSYQSQLPKPAETTSKFTIYLFATRQQWEDFTKAFTGPQAELYCKIKAGAYYLNGACVAYNIGRDRTFSVLGHEGWHQFNSRYFKYRLPSWLDEGIAMQFETSRYERGLFYFEPTQNLYRLGGLKKTLIENQMIPVKELVAINPGQVVAVSDQAVTAFYCQSYALVRFLREDNYGKRLGNFHQLLLGGLRGSWPLDEAAKKIAADRNVPLTVAWNQAVGSQLFQQYIADFDQIQGDYTAFCKKLVYHVRFKN